MSFVGTLLIACVGGAALLACFALAVPTIRRLIDVRRREQLIKRLAALDQSPDAR